MSDERAGRDRPPAVQVAGRGQRATIAASLARAFADDPAMTYIFPDRRRRLARMPAMFAMLFDSDAASGVRLATADGAAATFWRGPGHAATGPGEMLRFALPMLASFGIALPRALAVAKAIDAHHPRFPFWYLHIAGCDPAVQGRGLGKLVVQSGIDRFAGSGVPLYLETATEKNIGFYQQLGFTVTDRWRVGNDGPAFWSMLRAA